MNRKRRILLIHTGTVYGGVDVHLLNLIALLKDDVEFYAFCSNPAEQMNLRRQGAKDFWMMRGGRFDKWTRLLLCLMLFPLFIFALKIDVVWSHGGYSNIFLPFSRFLGRKSVATQHSHFVAESLRGMHYLRQTISTTMSRKLLFFAERVICVSPPVASAALKVIPASKIVDIPNWVKLPSVGASQISSRIRQLRILFVGRLEEFKDVSVILRAMRVLGVTNVACGIEFTVVGEGTHKQALMNEARGMPVQFAGFRMDPSEFYRRADICINPSLGPEGFPLTSLEGMSFGVPTILSDLPIHRLMLGESSAALLFRRGDAADLAEKVSMLWRTPLAEELGTAGRNLVAMYHSESVARLRYQREIATWIT